HESRATTPPGRLLRRAAAFRQVKGATALSLSPQQPEPAFAGSGWRPQVVDYLYVSFTNATAFSPTDAMPLSRWAKMLMLVESAASLPLALTVWGRDVELLQSQS